MEGSEEGRWARARSGRTQQWSGHTAERDEVSDDTCNVTREGAQHVSARRRRGAGVVPRARGERRRSRPAQGVTGATAGRLSRPLPHVRALRRAGERDAHPVAAGCSAGSCTHPRRPSAA